MSHKITRILAIAALAGTTSLLATSPAEARDWRQSVDRHYSAADEAKYTPRGDNPQWDFSLNTVVNDMAWRERTAEMLRGLQRPGQRDRVAQEADDETADRPEPSRFRFAF